ncbi:MAG TPA: FAD-dependent oxidoreductase [Candidatus Thermoplasmatota archaeon]|nr:FAD-dependent oxidoreductase [Candidatus Thermoplasmatota archaeon]
MKVVILGGGFCGAWVAKKLDANPHLEVALIDTKEYFEYTPSIWKLLTDASYHNRIVVPYKRFIRRGRVSTDSLVRVTPTTIETKKETIRFDYLVISTGIDYPIFLDNATNVFTVKSGTEVLKFHQKVAKAKSILIIGGGVIGTEVAAELSIRTRGKQITVVHPFDRLLERNTPWVSEYAKRFLEARGVQIVFGEKIVGHEKNVFVTGKGRQLKVDLGIWCAGIRWNPWFMKDFPSSIFSEKKALKVNAFLQLEGFPRIFVGGDINNVDEEKTAAAADRQAIFIAENLARMVSGKSLHGYAPIQLPMDISLSVFDGIITYPPFMIPGGIPGFVKLLVEKIALHRL